MLTDCGHSAKHMGRAVGAHSRLSEVLLAVSAIGPYVP